MQLTAVARPPQGPPASVPWINGRRWDVTWLIASAVVVPLGLLIVHAGATSAWVNFSVTVLVGGPHLFATYLATYMDPRFRKAHVWVLLAATVAVPAFVFAMTLWQFQILLSLFIFAASAHVLQQNAYLAGVYRLRAGKAEPRGSRWIDYGALGLSFYPVASYKLARHEFALGDVEILVPEFTRTPATCWTISLLFAGFMTAWIVKSIGEYRRRTLNPAKALLIGVTCPIAFMIPVAADGPQLELAFQTVNLWHSIQYLALVWFILKARKDRGRASSRFIEKISGSGWPAVLFYGLCVLITLMLLLAVAALTASNPFSLAPVQYYYMVVLSALLIHYVLDGFLFAVSNGRNARPEDNPYAELARTPS